MAAIRNETRGLGPLQVFDAVLIDDPAEQERLNRTLRRPDENRKSRKTKTDGAMNQTKKHKRSNHRPKRKKKR
jgi:hypothetical protein